MVCLTQDFIGPLATITEYRDIAGVFPENSNRKLRELPQSINPLHCRAVEVHSTLLQITQHPLDRLRSILPVAQSVCVVWARQRPKLPLTFTDKLYLISCCCSMMRWMYAWMTERSLHR